MPVGACTPKWPVRGATSIAHPGCSTEGATHAQNTDDVFHACRQHCGTDAACQRAISKSCNARAGGRASGISGVAKYRAATDLHVSEVWRDTRKHEISVWTVPLASARPRPVTAFHGVSAGLATAVYAGSEGLSVLALDCRAFGGQPGASARSRTTSASRPEFPGLPSWPGPTIRRKSLASRWLSRMRRSA
jgi:hypothetical protein